MSEECLIFFTKSPQIGRCKTRLDEFLKANGSLKLASFLIKKNYKIVRNFENLVFYDGNLTPLQNLINKANFYPQEGDNIGEKMKNAFKKAFSLGYKKVVLIGSDLDNLKKEDINLAFKKLKKFSYVFSPSDDGGYSLIGLKNINNEIFNIEFSSKFVLSKTLEILKKDYFLIREIKDIDTKFDIFSKFLKTKNIKFLASGEYNSNYIYKKGSKNYLFRINHASQMNLENQIEYEFKALKILKKSKVTPKVYKLFKKSIYLPRGALSMEFIKGRNLDYDLDLKKAAFILAKIHDLKIPKNSHLIVAKKPFLEIFKECENMAKIYFNSKFCNKKIEIYLKNLFSFCRNLNLDEDIKNHSIINTELNSSNFIISKKSYLIDWEKPIIGDSEQDLGHFLAPTTTFFKSDKILTISEIRNFLDEYEKFRKIDRILVLKYIKFNCLRGLSWCAMASVAHQNKNAPKNSKISIYLEDEFLKIIDKFINLEKL